MADVAKILEKISTEETKEMLEKFTQDVSQNELIQLEAEGKNIIREEAEAIKGAIEDAIKGGK